MTPDLRGRSLLKEADLTVEEWEHLLSLAADLKAARREGREEQRLRGRVVALVFEKTSTRTRCAFEVALVHQGAHATYLDPSGSQLGHKESVADTARVLGRMFDGVQYRGNGQAVVEELAAHAGVPVWNGLTDEWHPTQSLCDVLTLREHVRPAGRPVSVAYLGDARNNVANSLLVGAAMSGMDVRVVAPAPLQPSAEVVATARERAALTGGTVTVTDDVAAGVAGADAVYTDVWVSMGEPDEVWEERVDLLRPYRVTEEVLDATGRPDAVFLHCLPAYHDRRTATGEKAYRRFGLDGVEVSHEVFEGPRSVVFDQAENRLHTIKAVLVATLGG